MTAPAGLLATANFADRAFRSIAIEPFAPEASEMLRLSDPYPLLLAATACAPGAMPVKVQGVTHKGLPSKVICAPAGFEDTVSCDRTGAAAGRDLVFLPRLVRAEASVDGAAVSAFWG